MCGPGGPATSQTLRVRFSIHLVTTMAFFSKHVQRGARAPGVTLALVESFSVFFRGTGGYQGALHAELVVSGFAHGDNEVQFS